MKLAEYQVRKLTEQLDQVVAERDQLRVALAAATARAEAAEAKLAAVPRDAISSVICETAVHLDRAQLRQQLDMIRRWAAQQAVQP